MYLAPINYIVIVSASLTPCSCQQTEKEHEEGETEPHVQIPPPAVPHPARAAGRILCPVAGHVPDHGAGQPAIRPAHQAGSSPPDHHVLLPKPPGFL